MSKISRVHAREVLDSRGNPTVEVEVFCHGGARGRAIVPSGASTGRHEARELRDGEPERFGGLGVRRAVHNVNEILAPKLVGRSAAEQAMLDRLLCELDGTPDKSRLGANAILGVSLACAHAAAAARGVPLWRHIASLRPPHPTLSPSGGEGGVRPAPRLPLPMVNLISGGLHAGGNVEFQDFLLMPIGARSFADALLMTVAVYRALAANLKQHGFESVLVGDEGGFGPKLTSNEQALQLIVEAIEQAGLVPGKDAGLAIDVASSHFYRDGHYHLRDRPNLLFSAEDMTSLLDRWVGRYPILSIEDPLAEDDWEGWRRLTELLRHKVQLIGDDLFVTNPVRLRQGIAEKVANSVLVKLNQIGTLTETLEVVALAQAAGYRPVISARSGESEDSTIADLAVATGAGQIKIGSVARGERLAKYNQLLRIEEELGEFSRWEELSPSAPSAPSGRG